MTTHHFKEIKEFYNSLTPLILKYTDGRCRVSPYGNINWIDKFTDIEFQTWQVIRCYGCSLYPQYPVGKYFVDFGNPVLKIAIECDGKEYHLDKEKDYRRDLELSKLGWTVFKITGADCNRKTQELTEILYYEDPSEMNYLVDKYFRRTIEGLIYAINTIYFNKKMHGNQLEFQLSSLSLECLEYRISIITPEFEKVKYNQLEQVWYT